MVAPIDDSFSLRRRLEDAMDEIETYQESSQPSWLSSSSPSDQPSRLPTASPFPSASPSGQPSAEIETYQDSSGASEGEVILNTLQVYGSIFLACFVVFCCLRKKYPRYFNVRSWSPKIRCDLASDQHGFIRWMWELYGVKDDDILEQCGMDALCFLRSLYFGVKLSLMGIANAIWLMPIYATSRDASEAPSQLVKVSTSYVPAGSNRFYATVIASYILFLYAMFLILKEFKWYTKYRHKFLMEKKPRNYAVYVTGIPDEYRSSYALKEYFRQCFSKEGVLEAHVAMEIPDLDRKVNHRKRVIKNLEHAIALERLRKIVAVRQSVHISTGRMKQRELVEIYEEQLETLNEDIKDSIRKIRFRNDRMKDMFERSKATRSGLSEEVDEEEEDEFTNMDWKAYRNFKLFPLNATSSNDSPTIRRRRLSTIDSAPCSPFSMGSPYSSGEDSSLGSFDDFHYDDVEGGLRIDTHGETMTHASVGEHDQATPRTMNGGSSDPGLGIFETNEAEENVATSVLSPDDPSAVFANMFFGATLTPTVRKQQDVTATEDAPRSVTNHDTTEEESVSVHKQENSPFPAVTIPAVKSSDDEPFNCPTIVSQPISNDPSTLHTNSLFNSAKECGASQPAPRSHLEQGANEQSDTQVSPAPALISDSEHTSDPSDLTNTESERSSRRSMRHMTKLPQEVSLRASNIVKEGSGKVKKVVVGGSGQVKKAVVEGSGQVKGLVVDGSQQVTKVVKGGSQQVTKVVVDGSQQVTKRVNPENIKKAADYGVKNVKKATDAGVSTIVKAKDAGVGNVRNFANYVFGNGDGTPRDAGFVVFSKLSTTHAALQMIHHPKPYVMDVQEAPMPEDIYWKNVGMPHKAQEMGKLTSLGLTGLLCLTWTVPVSFISSLTEVDALRESVPFIDNMLTKAPWMEAILGLLAPLLLLGLNAFLPLILRYISTFEGHIAGSALEASLFRKMAAFQIVQTFFVSALSGSVWAELSNILRNPEELIDLLARSLPVQSTYFIQIILVDTFVGLSLELLRVIPLSTAALRRIIGPNLTKKERNTPFLWLHPLSDPWDFQMAEIFGEGVLFFVVLFVYAPIAPITCFFLLFCWLLMGSCYRHQFFYNCVSLDSGGKMWSYFISICLGCILIAELTLVGMLALKKAPIQSILMIPLIIITILFNFYIGKKHVYVTGHLPTRLCLQLDRKHYANGGLDFSFVRQHYLQPALLEQDVHSSRSEERPASRALDDGASECSRSSKRVSAIRIRV